MIYWIIIGALVVLIGGWGAFALWILPYPDTARLIPDSQASKPLEKV